MVLFCGFVASLAYVGICAADTPARLVIVNALYGNLSDPAATTNVTKIVAALVNNDTLDFHPNNDILGGDPAPNIPKQLQVDYTIDGVDGSKTAFEGGNFKLSAIHPASAKKSRLVILKAVYGDLPNGQSSDVTANLADMVENDSLEVTVGNNGLGDPAWGKSKQLDVDYAFNGWKKSIIVPEGKTLKISARVELAEIHKRILIRALWIISGLLAVSAVVAAVVLLTRKWKKSSAVPGSSS